MTTLHLKPPIWNPFWFLTLVQSPLGFWLSLLPISPLNHPSQTFSSLSGMCLPWSVYSSSWISLSWLNHSKCISLLSCHIQQKSFSFSRFSCISLTRRISLFYSKRWYFSFTIFFFCFLPPPILLSLPLRCLTTLITLSQVVNPIYRVLQNHILIRHYLSDGYQISY